MKTDEELKTFWKTLAPEDLAAALRTIPKLVAYAWRQSDDGTWSRGDVVEFGVADAARVYRNEDGTWRGPVRRIDGKFVGFKRFPSAEEAKVAYDKHLVDGGWILVDSTDGTKENA